MSNKKMRYTDEEISSLLEKANMRFIGRAGQDSDRKEYILAQCNSCKNRLLLPLRDIINEKHYCRYCRNKEKIIKPRRSI